jgi:pimeloyl-ACP methyl ester carboxylesterase
MKHIYFISGFGADERVFANVDFGENQTHFIPWKIPNKTETIEAYAGRMLEAIHHPNPILIGLSFGGMVAIEIAKLISLEKIILFSSVKTVHEMPFSMKLASTISLNKWFPLKPYSFLEPIENYNLGAMTPEQKELLREYRKNIDPRYTSWAIDHILNWKNEWHPQNLIHLHGSNDHIFPLKYVKPDYIIKGGGHLMLMNNADQVNGILKTIL